MFLFLLQPGNPGRQVTLNGNSPTGQPQLHRPILITRRKIMSSNGLLKTGGNNVVPGCQQY